MPDPISISIRERKDDGSYLSVIKSRVSEFDNQPLTSFKFKGPGISSAQLKSQQSENTLGSGGLVIAHSAGGFDRRKLSDRKNKK